MEALDYHSTKLGAGRNAGTSICVVYEVQASDTYSQGLQVEGTPECAWWKTRVWHKLLLGDVITGCDLGITTAHFGTFKSFWMAHATNSFVLAYLRLTWNVK